MELYQKFVNNVKLRRYTVLLLIILTLYLARGMITMILLTFIFTYLAVHFIQFIQRYLKIHTFLLSLILYGGIIFFIYLALTKYIPIIVEQSIQTYNSVIDFYDQQPQTSNQILSYINTYLEQMDLREQIQNGAALLLMYLHDFGSLALTLIMSFVLSFFFMIEKRKMYDFSKLFLKGDFSWFFQDIYFFAQKFTNTFGVVLEAQFFIALVNTALTTVGLSIIGFSQLPSLALMTFLFSLVPVAGVIISCVPLSFIAYSKGGINDVLFVFLMIVIIHLLEAYVLNPKFMSSRTELPIFYTFVILLVSEHVFGAWGLIVGIPIFTFFLDILKVKPIPSEVKPH